MSNLLDKAIAAMSPERALRRQLARKKLQVLNSGYGNYGANRTKGSTKGWMDGGGSSREDIEDNLPVLRQRSRDLYMGAPLATGAVKTYRTSVIGEGLSLKPKIDAERLGLTEEAATALEKTISREWELWADSTDCDAARLSNFYELQQLAFLNWILSGDVIALLPSWQRPGSIYDLHINLIEADRVRTPAEKDRWDSDRIVDGVERNNRGEVVAYYIARNHPLGRQGYDTKCDRVAAYGRRTGRRNVLHIMNRERIGQVRGVPILAPVIEALKQIARYTDAELTAAVLAGYFTVFIENGGEEVPIGEIIPEEARIDNRDETTVELGQGAVVELGEGEKISTASPGRPNTSFDGFVLSICKQIGAALELPQELLLKQFTASYSASRGALLEAWKTFDMYRDWMASGFCQPIYEEWLSEAVLKGRISAPGFFTDPAIRRGYCRAEWYGPSRGQLDPLKEVNAAALRVRNGFSTGARESMELTSTDYGDNVTEITREAEMWQGYQAIVKAQEIPEDKEDEE